MMYLSFLDRQPLTLSPEFLTWVLHQWEVPNEWSSPCFCQPCFKSWKEILIISKHPISWLSRFIHGSEFVFQWLRQLKELIQNLGHKHKCHSRLTHSMWPVACQLTKSHAPPSIQGQTSSPINRQDCAKLAQKHRHACAHMRQGERPSISPFESYFGLCCKSLA